MPLAPGTRLGHYEATAPIGAGGMGEVYRARDTKLDRDVAIKVLPGAFTADAERLARFQREAKLLAALNHTNIASIYGLEEADGKPFLVLELVEGEDLAERLRGGAIPLDEALAIARQIAEALEEAHERGIVHRDLKPANVKVTPDGKVKVLDFGLAKAYGGDGEEGSKPELSHSPTMTRGTEVGMILGTAAYMSPEQARGKPVDKRADIWSFGVVLFEMLTGTRLFSGETVSDVLAAVLTRDANLRTLPPETPGTVRQLLRRCLDRDPKHRLRDIGDARIDLEPAHDPETQAPDGAMTPRTTAGRSRFARVWPIAAAALALAGWAATAALLGTPARHPAIDLKASLALPESVTIPVVNYVGNPSLAALAISPQGDKVAFVGVKDGQGALYLRRLDRFEAARLPNTGSATAPFFSPDGERLGFFARGRLWRIDLPDGVPVDVGPAPKESVGSWGEDGRIVYSPSWSDALWAIPERGGESRAFTKIDRAAGEISHRWPCVLPGGAGVLFTIKSASDRTFDEAAIAIADAGIGAHRVLIKGGSKPRYLDSGQLVFMREGRLYTVAFDLASRSIRGTPAPALQGVTASGVTGNAWYDVSRAGDLVYLAGANTYPAARLSWEGPGRAAVVMGSLDSDWAGSPVLSSDLKRAVVRIGGANDKLGLIDLERKNLTRLTSGGGNDFSGILSKDGRWLIFTSDRAGGGFRHYRMPMDGSAPPTPLLDGEGFVDLSISYGAGLLGFSLTSERDGEDAYILAVSEDGAAKGKPILVAGGPNYQGAPMASPDGKLVTWVSSESGRDEVYVRHLGDSGSRRRLTNTGGHTPRWNRQGNRIFYITDRGIVSVALRSAADLSFGDPQAVTRPVGADRINGYDVAADGTSVLFSLLDEPPPPSRDIRLWRGWGETVRAVHQ